jgi:hypothetical protein
MRAGIEVGRLLVAPAASIIRVDFCPIACRKTSLRQRIQTAGACLLHVGGDTGCEPGRDNSAARPRTPARRPAHDIHLI